MKVSFLIPFRDADGTRTKGHQWLLKRWQHFYPEAEFCIAPDDGIDPFNKSMAVNNAAAMATGDVYVILDADTWIATDWMERALGELTKGRSRFIAPSRNMRLKKDISDRLMAGDPTGPFVAPASTRDIDGTIGPVVGFLWVILASAFWDMAWHNDQGQARGMDERIRGWGGEDTAFRMAAKAIIGPPRRMPGTVICLWHDRPRTSLGRYWVGQVRSTETKGQKGQVMHQYRTASANRARMRQVLGQP